ncbi:hypothetical protein OF83DRAFT_1045983, partial [Amylostereum chailletii]
SKYLEFSTGLELIYVIGVWHIHGHMDKYFPKFAPLNIPGIGYIDGEIVETLWTILN